MVLKEAFRYKNHLESLLNEAERYLANDNNFMLIKEEHLRSKAVSGAEDEVKTNVEDRVLDVSADVVVGFMMKVYEEILSLDAAMLYAKQNHCNTMDTSLSENKTRQTMVLTLKSMLRTKGRDRMATGTALTFNAEGNQVRYQYDIKRTSSPDFDRANVKRLANALSLDANTISTRLDYWLSSVPVNFEPKFSIDDSFEESVDQFSLDTAS